MKQFFTYVPGSHFNIVEMLFLGEPFKIEHVDTHGVTILFFSKFLVLLRFIVTSYQHFRWSGRSMLILS